MPARHRPFAAIAVLIAAATSLPSGGACAEGLVDNLVQRFAHSDFEFLRAKSNAPFLPLAWVTATNYQRGEFDRPDDTEAAVTFQQRSISQGAFIPLPMGERDIFVVGDWLSLTHFDLHHSAMDDLDVLSVAVPVGWIRQSSPKWQVAAFVAPLGHKTDGDDWYWETLGGVFARRLASERFAWIVGFYVDVAPLEDFYTPYFGATYIINERWTLNGVLPWPSVIYAPTPDTMFRLGVAPSGSSWSIEPGERHPRLSLSAWNVGLGAEHRIYRNMWMGAEAGFSGLRGLSLQGSDWQKTETKLDGTGYVLLTVNWRVNP